jgi:hypothetical protein
LIDGIDNALKTWIVSALGDVDVSLEPPGACPHDGCVSLYLLDMQHAPPATRGRSKIFSLSLRYLVTTWDEDPLEAHRRLGELATRVAEHPDYDIDLDALPVDIWPAFGVPPRPAFVLRAPCVPERALPAVDLIREPPIVRAHPLGRFEGILLGPGDLPVVGARVELPAFGRHAVSDRRGYFCLTAVPLEPARKQLRIRAKGRDLATTTEHRPDQPGPVTIHLDLTEA